MHALSGLKLKQKQEKWTMAFMRLHNEWQISAIARYPSLLAQENTGFILFLGVRGHLPHGGWCGQLSWQQAVVRISKSLEYSMTSD